MTEISFSEVDIVRKGLATMAEQDTGENEGVTDVPVVADRAPRDLSDRSSGLFVISVDDGADGGTFSITLNGQETGIIVWDADDDTLQARILSAIQALPVGAGVVID